MVRLRCSLSRIRDIALTLLEARDFPVVGLFFETDLEACAREFAFWKRERRAAPSYVQLFAALGVPAYLVCRVILTMRYGNSELETAALECGPRPFPPVAPTVTFS